MESPLPQHVPEPMKEEAIATIMVPPSPRRQSWGAVVSIVIIVLMIIIGAFYAWGKRIAEERSYAEQAASSTTQ